MTRLLLKRITKAMTPGLLNIQHGALSGRNTTTLTTKLMNNLHKSEGYLAKAFPSVPRTMITDIIREAGAPEPIIWIITEIYSHTPAALYIHCRDHPYTPSEA